MCSVPSKLPVSVFVFITYSWHLTRTGSADPGFGKKEQVVDEQVSLTHLHGSTRKNKRERVETGGGRRRGRERSDVFPWMRCVTQLADCLLAVPQSSRHASPADSALRKKEREERISQMFLIFEGRGSLGSLQGPSSLSFTPGTPAVSPKRYYRELLTQESFTELLMLVSNHASVAVGKFSSTASSHKPETSGLS